MSRSPRNKVGSPQDVRQVVDRLSVERLLSETTILRVTLDFIQEKGLGGEYAKYLRRRSR
jgi:hypothetical protein